MRAHPTMHPDRALDVYKYAICLDDPRKGSRFPVVLLNGATPTIRNKTLCIMEAKVTKRVLDTIKTIEIIHPVLSNYQAIAKRMRFLRGFSSNALQKLGKIWERMGYMGLTHQRFPANQGLLMDPDLLTSAAFDRVSEKEAVPPWRDGAQGHALQERMADHLSTRYFDFDYHKQADPKLFLNAKTWVAFSRIMPYVQQHLDNLKKTAAAEMTSVREREIWKGEHDAHFLQLSLCLPDTVSDLSSRVYEQFEPLRGLVACLAEVAHGGGETEKKDAEGGKMAEQVAIAKVEAGNVSSYIPNFKSLSKGEKLDMATKMAVVSY